MDATAVIASIAGGLFVLLFQWFWKNIMPDITMHLLKRTETRIAGDWKSSFMEEGKQYSENVKLKQRGRNVTAIITLRDDDEDIVYKFKGTFQNLILSGTYISADEANFERGAILLRYKRKGKFVGQTSYFSKTSDKLVSSHYEWDSA